VKRPLVLLGFRDVHAKKEPRSVRNPDRHGLCCRAFRLSAFLALSVLTSCRDAVADEWMYPSATNAAWTQPVDIEQSARLPPVDLTSYDAATMEQPIEPYRPFIGYDNGFVIADQGTERVSPNDFPFLMRVKGWTQIRYVLFNSDCPNPDENTISFERLRLSLGGHVYSPSLQYFIQVDGNSDRSMQTHFWDAFVSYDLGRDLFGCEANKLGIKAGKWKVPFSRSREETARRLQFTERSVGNHFFDLNRSVGAGLYGEIEAWSQPIVFETAVFNGYRTGAVSTVRGMGLDENLAWSLRTHTDLFSEFGDDGEPDLSWHPAPALRLGAGMALSRVDAEGQREFSRQRVVDSGVTLASLLPPGVDAYDVDFFTLDAHWKYHGFSLITEYHWRYMAEFHGGSVPSLLDHGLVLQTGYFVCPQKLELLFRWSPIVGNSGTLGSANRNSNEVAAGFAWYLKGHNAKFGLDASYVSGVPVTGDRLDLLPGDVGWLLRTQFQLGF
jgi:hypothetical protein